MYVVEDLEPKSFEFKIKNKKYSIPLFQYMPYTVMLDLQKKINEAMEADDKMQLLELVSTIFEEYAPDALEKLTTKQFSDLMGAYFEANNATVGE